MGITLDAFLTQTFKGDIELPPEATFRMYFLMVDEEVRGTR